MEILKGKPVAEWIDSKTREEATRLIEESSIVPTLAILRVGNNESDIAYENSAVKKAANLGIHIEKFILEDSADESDVLDIIKFINEQENIHGLLMFRPLPHNMDEEKICNHVRPEKDIDGITERTLGGIFTGAQLGFPPCTPEAAMAILKYYGIDPAGKRVVVVGRSLVVGKPAAIMLLNRNATVTICHSKTPADELKAVCQDADIIICATGRRNTITAEHVNGKQVIIDVGINFDENDKMCGDADCEGIAEANGAAAITPVPGGVGAVTTALLMYHVAKAASIATK